MRSWLTGVRPLLMFSYWVNYKLWGDEPLSYHLVNLLIHLINSGLVFLVLSRLLSMAGWIRKNAYRAAVLGAAVFLIHPLQTESVSYIAGRSESLAALCALLAYAIFLYRKNERISWLEALGVLFLFGCAVLTKENAVSLAGILILTDVFWPKPFSLAGLRNNWRLYLLMAPGAVAAVAWVFHILASAPSAGFADARFKWYTYAFTEARAIFTYIRLAIFPVGQSLDHDFAPSRTITDHGAIVYIVILAVLLCAAIAWRRRYPLFCFGLLSFLTWLAPTSSVIPIDDPLVERRMYVPLTGLILMACDIAPRVRISRNAVYAIAAFVALAFGGLCYARNQLWGAPDKIMALAAMNASSNPRPLLNLTEILIQRNRCDLAIPYLERAERILPNSYFVNVAWGRTLACLNRHQEALARFQRAALIQPTSKVYEWMGLVYGKMGELDLAGQSLQKAVELGPDSESAHGSLALWYETVHNLPAAEQQYCATIALDHSDLWAQMGLRRVRRLMASQNR